MSDVARLAGVSHQTVSRVINNHASVRESTRERVRQAVAQLGYRPNVAARALRARPERLGQAVGEAGAAEAGDLALAHGEPRADRAARRGPGGFGIAIGRERLARTVQ